MSEVMCRYEGDREQAIVSYLYDEWDQDERAAFEAHLTACARCRTDVKAFKAVRAELRAWTPSVLQAPGSGLQAPDGPPAFGLQPPASRLRFAIPAWLQAVAAVFLIGVAAGAANLDVRHDASGWRVRTGWMRAPEAAPRADVVSRADLAALETRLRTEAAQNAANLASFESPANPANPEAAALKKLRALVEESERRQQRELALRVAEVLRDVNAERQSDLARIDRSMGALQNTYSTELLRQRETLNNVLVRTSLQR
jgi:hypothetical protein